MYDLRSQLLNVNKSVCIGDEIVYRIPFTSIARFGFFELGEFFVSIDCSISYITTKIFIYPAFYSIFGKAIEIAPKLSHCIEKLQKI